MSSMVNTKAAGTVEMKDDILTIDAPLVPTKPIMIPSLGSK